METLKVGDVVKLKSGSPDMTIQKIKLYIQTKKPYAAMCYWFDGDVLKSGLFNLETLEKKSTPSI